MTEYDTKALSLVLSHIEKILVAQTEKILSVLESYKPKATPGPKPVATSIRLRRAYDRNKVLRRELRELHKLLELETKKLIK